MYKKTKEFGSENEAKRANKHANKKIISWPPFWNKVYRNREMTEVLSYVTQQGASAFMQFKRITKENIYSGKG